MITKIFKSVCAVCAICGLAACSDFLEQENQTQLSESQVLSDVELADLNMKSIYDAFKENYKDEPCRERTRFR